MATTRMSLAPASYLAALKANGQMITVPARLSLTNVMAIAQSASHLMESASSARVVSVLTQQPVFVKNLMLTVHTHTDLLMPQLVALMHLPHLTDLFLLTLNLPLKSIGASGVSLTRSRAKDLVVVAGLSVV